MKYEWLIAGKYLIPRKKRLSMSLIALLSIFVISLVVWLALIFLSFNEGMKNRWLQQLTTFNAPIKIIPTPAYFKTYYHKIDEQSLHSDFTKKILSEKLLAEKTDPYDPLVDAELDPNFPKPILDESGHLRDLVKELSTIIQDRATENRGFDFYEYLISTAMMQLKVKDLTGHDPNAVFLSQACSLSAFSSKNKQLLEFVQPIRKEDIIGLNAYEKREKIKSSRLFPYFSIPKASLDPKTFILPAFFLPEETSYQVELNKNSVYSPLILSKKGKAKLIRKSHRLEVMDEKGNTHRFPLQQSLQIQDPIPLKNLEILSDQNQPIIALKGHAQIQGHELLLHVDLNDVLVEKIEIIDSFPEKPLIEPYWPYYNETTREWILPNLEEGYGLIAPKTLCKNGACLGDQGELQFLAKGLSGLKEQKIRYHILGFYDPGVMNVGFRFFFAPKELIQTINASSHILPLDRKFTNGFHIHLDQLNQTQLVAETLRAKLQQTGLAEFFQVIPFYEFDFAQDLMGQLKSDQILLSLIAAIILLVACSNIVSFLIILVSDKRKEIAILRSMGATTLSIACIFGLVGLIVGLLGCLLGVIASYFTLANLETIMHVLSSLNGQDFLNAQFYGDSLPNQLSSSALTFIALITPLTAVIAGLIPAIKAARLKPNQILRADA